MPWSESGSTSALKPRPARISRQDAWQPARVESLNHAGPLELLERERRAAAEAAERELQRQVEAAWQNGHEAGRQAALAEQQEQARQLGMDLRARHDSLMASLQQGLQALENGLADQLLALALQFGEKIACHHLAQVPESICAVLAEAIQQLGRQYRNLEIALHPDEVAAVSQWLALNQPDMTVKVIGRPGISPGGCLINAGSMQVDARLETRIERAWAGMGLPAGAADQQPASGDDAQS